MLTKIISQVRWAIKDTAFQGLMLPAFALGVMLGVGAYIASSLSVQAIASFGLLIGVLAGSYLYFIGEAAHYRAQALLAVSFGLLVGLIVAVTKAHSVAAPRITAPTYPVYVEGWVSGIDYGKSGPRIRIKVHAIEGLAKEETPHFVRLTHISRLEMAPGRFVRCWSVMRPPPKPSIPGDFDFQRRAWFVKLGGVGYVRGKCRGGALGPPTGMSASLVNSLAAFRFALSRYVSAYSHPATQGLSAALVTGDRSGLAQAQVEDLRTVGLSHLLAISGLHLGLVCGLAFGFFRGIFAIVPWLGQRVPSPYAGAWAALICGTVYLLLSGASVSTQRAYIMSVVFFSAMLLDRNALSLRGFSIALILVLLLQPQSIVGAGFQMSFAATGALILVYASWNRYRYEKGFSGRGKWLRFFLISLAITSVVAGLATLPFSYYHFGRTAPLTLPANMIVMPIVSLITAPSAAFAAIMSPLDGGKLGLGLYSTSLNWIVEISAFFANLSRQIFGEGPSAPVNMPMTSALVFFGAIICVLIKFDRRFLISGIGIGFVAILVWALHPKPVAYLARDGLIYWQSRDPGRGWVSAPIMEGDALPPMKLQGFVSPLPQCSEAVCDIENLRQPTWPETRTLFEKGSLLYKQFGQHKFRSSKCGHRPWAECVND